MGADDLNNSDIKALRQCPLTRALPENAFAAVLSNSEIMNLKRGDRLFDMGERAAKLFVVLEGWVNLTSIEANGRTHSIAIFSRAESLAEAVAFVGARYPASAQAITAARILAIRGEKFLETMMSDRAVLGSGLAAIYHHLHYLVTEVENLKSRTVRQRTAAFLAGLTSSQGGSLRIELPFEKSLLAAKIGTSPENLSRTLASLKDIGVTIDRSHVNIDDLALLRREAGLDDADP